MSHPEGEDIWTAFDDAVEAAQSGLEAARRNFEAIEQLGDRLPPVYGIALDELTETVQRFDSIYEVNESELDEARAAARRADLLVDVTGAHRRFLETVLKRRVTLLGEWFDSLNESIAGSDVSIDADIDMLRKQLLAARKLVEAGKHTQVRTSDKVDLESIEGELRTLDDESQTDLSTSVYVERALGLLDSFHDRTTDDLSTLVAEGADRSAISVKERMRNAPNLDDVESRLAEEQELQDGDIDDVGRGLEIHFEVALSTGRRWAEFELGNALVDAVWATIEDEEAEKELRELVERFELEELRERVAATIGEEATTSEREQVLRILRQHDGSVRRTLAAVDQGPEEIFSTLRELLVEGDLADLEARFE